jgi:hypothetical protein
MVVEVVAYVVARNRVAVGALVGLGILHFNGKSIQRGGSVGGLLVWGQPGASCSYIMGVW